MSSSLFFLYSSYSSFLNPERVIVITHGMIDGGFFFLISYLIGLHNPRTCETRFIPAPLHILTRQVKSLKNLQPIAPSFISNERNKLRNALGETHLIPLISSHPTRFLRYSTPTNECDPKARHSERKKLKQRSKRKNAIEWI